MAKLYFNTRDELSCIETDMIAVVQANGNYSRVVYITKKDVTLTTGISKLEQTLKSYNGKKNRFIRLGRSLIINHSYLIKVDVRGLLGISHEMHFQNPRQLLHLFKKVLT